MRREDLAEATGYVEEWLAQAMDVPEEVERRIKQINEHVRYSTTDLDLHWQIGWERAKSERLEKIVRHLKKMLARRGEAASDD